ncbi:hypothetical protein [Haliangium sp.]|uniref:hypothetical protein n=1 Tax=Haliangium sp. TaxID=2663208 RepID=UPI003D14DB8F
MSEPREVLTNLLKEIFSAEEVRRWVHRALGESAFNGLVGERATLDDVAFEAAGLAKRHGRIDERLFAALLDDRPGQQTRIIEAAHRCQIELTQRSDYASAEPYAAERGQAQDVAGSGQLNKMDNGVSTLLDYKFFDEQKAQSLMRQLNLSPDPRLGQHDKATLLFKTLEQRGYIAERRLGETHFGAMSNVSVRATFVHPRLQQSVGQPHLHIWVCPPLRVLDVSEYHQTRGRFTYLVEAPWSTVQLRSEGWRGCPSGVSALWLLLRELRDEWFNEDRNYTLLQWTEWAQATPLRTLAYLGAQMSAPTHIQTLYIVHSFSDELFYRPDHNIRSAEIKKRIGLSEPEFGTNHQPPPGRYEDCFAYPLYVARVLS